VLLQNSHPERPRPGRRLGGLANLFTSRHRNSGSPSSTREEIEGGSENVGDMGESSNKLSPSLSPRSDRPVLNNLKRPTKGTTVTTEATNLDTGSGNVKTLNSRVPNSSRFARNLSNTNAMEASNRANNSTGDVLSDNEESKRVSSSRQTSRPAISDKKRTALLHRGKEKRSLLLKQDPEDGECKLLSVSKSQHQRLEATSSDSEVVVRRSSRSRNEPEKEPQKKIRYDNALSLR